MDSWFCTSADGQEHGPFSGAQLKQLAAQGKITGVTMVRRGAQGQWVPASRIQGLFATQQSAPISPSQASPSPATVQIASRTTNSDITPSPTRVAPAKGSGTSRLIENPLLVFFSTLFCFPVGLFFVWKHRTWTVRTKWIWTGVCVLLLMSVLFKSEEHSSPSPKAAEPSSLADIIPEPLTWDWALAAFGPNSRLSASQKTTLFDHVKGKKLEISGKWRYDSLLGSYVRPVGFDHDVKAPWEGSERDYVARLQNGDRVCMVGRLVDYPGVFSSFALDNCEFQRDKCQRAFDGLTKAEQQLIVDSELLQKAGWELEFDGSDKNFGPTKAKAPLNQRVEARVKTLATFQALRSLDLSGTAVTDSDLESLAALKNLETLGLMSAPHITDSGVVHIRRLPKLKALFLARTTVSAKGFATMSGIASLEQLALTRNQVNRDMLEPFKGNNRLKIGVADETGSNVLLNSPADDILAVLDDAGRLPTSEWPWTDLATANLFKSKNKQPEAVGVLLTFESHPPIVQELVEQGHAVWELADFGMSDDEVAAAAKEPKGERGQKNCYLIFDARERLTMIVHKEFYSKDSSDFDVIFGEPNGGAISIWMFRHLNINTGKWDISPILSEQWTGSGNSTRAVFTKVRTLKDEDHGLSSITTSKISIEDDNWSNDETNVKDSTMPNGQGRHFNETQRYGGKATLVKKRTQP